VETRSALSLASIIGRRGVAAVKMYMYCRLGSTAPYNVKLDRFCILAQVVRGYEKKRSIEYIITLEKERKAKLISTI